MRDIWRSHAKHKNFWKDLKITVVHTNEFYKTFIRFPSGEYFELMGVPKAVVHQYEILGETEYKHG